jgi:hypothetical protein
LKLSSVEGPKLVVSATSAASLPQTRHIANSNKLHSLCLARSDPSQFLASEEVEAEQSGQEGEEDAGDQESQKTREEIVLTAEKHTGSANGRRVTTAWPRHVAALRVSRGPVAALAIFGMAFKS